MASPCHWVFSQLWQLSPKQKHSKREGGSCKASCSPALGVTLSLLSCSAGDRGPAWLQYGRGTLQGVTTGRCGSQGPSLETNYKLRSMESSEQAGQWEIVHPPLVSGGLGSRGSGHRGRHHHGSSPPRAATARPIWLPRPQKHKGSGSPAIRSLAPAIPAPPRRLSLIHI